MTTMPLRAIALAMLLLGTASIGQGLAQTGQPAQGAMVTDGAEVRAIVETIDLATRKILLRGEEGGLMTVRVRPDVRRLNEIKPGDQIVVRYTEALAVRMAKPEEAGMPPSVETGASRAGSDQPPGAVAGDQATAIVTIQAVDPQRNTVTFVGPSGVTRRAFLQDPGLQEFARGLKPGDRVNVTYREAMAVSVEPARR